MEHFLNGEFNFSSRHSFTIYAVSTEFITYTIFFTLKISDLKKYLSVQECEFKIKDTVVYETVVI